MVLEWQRVDSLGLARAAQLTAKTNQFNLTTRRYTQAQLAALVEDPRALVLQFRLRDRYGDNGVIAIVVATPGSADGVLGIEAWLMSCRVLGRGVEAACLAVVAQAARAMGASALDGLYLPTERNGMVRDHYAGLGFARLDDAGEEAAGATRWRLDLARWDGAAALAQVGAIRIVPEPGA
jgi:FkbH-like protein